MKHIYFPYNQTLNALLRDLGYRHDYRYWYHNRVYDTLRIGDEAVCAIAPDHNLISFVTYHSPTPKLTILDSWKSVRCAFVLVPVPQNLEQFIALSLRVFPDSLANEDYLHVLTTLPEGSNLSPYIVRLQGQHLSTAWGGVDLEDHPLAFQQVWLAMLFFQPAEYAKDNP